MHSTRTRSCTGRRASRPDRPDVSGQKCRHPRCVCFDEGVAAKTYARAGDVVWRIGPDRVLVRKVGHEGLDLVGAAAMIWLALDEPRTLDAIDAELADAIAGSTGDVVDVEGTLAPLVAGGLVETIDARDAT